MELYKKFRRKAIVRDKPTINRRRGKSKLYVTIAAMLIIFNSCIKDDEIKYLENTQIFGSVKYNDPVKGEQPLPKNQIVNVVLDNNQNPFLSFSTSEAGRYNFSPFREGEYSLEFSFTDTVLQYDANLVRREDIDTLKRSSLGITNFTGKTKKITIDASNKSNQNDIVLTPKETGLKIFVSDDQNRPLYGARVCLYTNQAIAHQNAPFCGGAFAYLSSDVNGYVLFTDLQTQNYYLNASGKFGVVSVTNQWSNDMKLAKPDKEGEITGKQIILK